MTKMVYSFTTNKWCPVVEETDTVYFAVDADGVTLIVYKDTQPVYVREDEGD